MKVHVILPHPWYLRGEVNYCEGLTKLWNVKWFQAICERIWEKGPLRAEVKFLFLIAHNFKAVIATDLKPGIAILQSLHYTRRKFRAPPTSGLGVAIASIARGRKSAVLCLRLVPHRFR